MTVDTIARLKITLDDVKPEVRRRIEVPVSLRLDRLHLTIQAAMGWTNSHLFEIRAGDVGWGIPDPDWPNGPLDARKVRLIDVLEDTDVKTLHYIYDYGDNWQHTIKIERLIDPIPGDTYPRLIDATGRCPPEGAGGWPRYEEFLEAINNPKHERHAEIAEWTGLDRFDPAIVHPQMIEADLAHLTKKWTRKSPLKSPKRS